MILIKETASKPDNNKIWLFLSAAFVITLLVAWFLMPPVKTVKQPAVRLSAKITKPEFSRAAGFYKEDFLLQISVKNSQARIFYTLDGSEPTLYSTLYTMPVLIKDRTPEPNKLSEIKNSPVFTYPLNNVFKGTIVRAIAVLNDSLKSPEAQASFFVHPDGRKRYSLPVFSLITNPDNFFGYKNGIYVNGATTDDKDYYLKNNINIASYKEGFPTNYKRRGLRWERQVTLDYFEKSSNNGFQTSAGARIHGNATRERPQKSLKFYFDARYGFPLLKYPLLGAAGPTRFKTFLLRNSGQDMYKARLRDALTQELIKNNTSLDLQLYRPSIMFLNGEYWGIYDIRQRIDEFYFADKYRISLDSLTILGPLAALEYGDSTDKKAYDAMIAFIQHNDMAKSANFEKVAAQMDLPNYIDYVVIQCIIANRDWPRNNFTTWRYQIPAKTGGPANIKDGRWRFAIYDTDYAYGAVLPASHHQLNYILKTKEVGKPLVKLLANKFFRDLFFERFVYHLENTFETQRALSVIKNLEREIAPEMAEHLARWRTLNSVEEWKKEVDQVRDFARKRPGFQRKELTALRQKYAL